MLTAELDNDLRATFSSRCMCNSSVPLVPIVHPMYLIFSQDNSTVRGTSHQSFLSDTQILHIVS